MKFDDVCDSHEVTFFFLFFVFFCWERNKEVALKTILFKNLYFPLTSSLDFSPFFL